MRSNRTYGLQTTLAYEGGYVNDPRDPGGETNYGITHTTARANGYTGPMRSIPMQCVHHIYMTKYWTTPYYDGDKLAAGVDICVFDFGVHSGPSRAGDYLKKAVGSTPVDTVKKLSALRLGFLQRLKIWPTYSRGFTSRIVNLEARGVKLAIVNTGAKVQEGLVKESKDAQTQRNKEVAKGGGAGAVGGGAQTAPDPVAPPVPDLDTGLLPDPSIFDWNVIAQGGKWVLAIAVLGFLGLIGYRVYIHHLRAAAFKREAAVTVTQ